MKGYVLSSAACGVSQIFPACGAPKFGVGPTPNLGRLYPCGSQNWDGRKKGGCRHSLSVSFRDSSHFPLSSRHGKKQKQVFHSSVG